MSISPDVGLVFPRPTGAEARAVCGEASCPAKHEGKNARRAGAPSVPGKSFDFLSNLSKARGATVAYQN